MKLLKPIRPVTTSLRIGSSTGAVIIVRNMATRRASAGYFIPI